MKTEQEKQILTEEDMRFISKVSADPDASEEDKKKVANLYETKQMPDDVVEGLADLADESTDVGD